MIKREQLCLGAWAAHVKCVAASLGNCRRLPILMMMSLVAGDPPSQA